MSKIKKMMSLFLAVISIISCFAISSMSSFAATHGWVQSGSKWYYYLSNGQLAKGLTGIGGAKYYFYNPNDKAEIYKAVVANTSGSGESKVTTYKLVRQLNSNFKTGEMVTGFIKIGNTDYCFDASSGKGINGQSNYCVNDYIYVNGIRQYGTKFVKAANTWYYIKNSKIYSGFVNHTDGYKYYIVNGKMTIGSKKINNKWYYFNDNKKSSNYGAMYRNMWVTKNNKKYLYKSNGTMAVSEWQTVGNNKYFFNTQGHMLTGWHQIDGKWYYFKSDGAMATGWVKTNNKWYYLNNNGVMQTGKKKINGKTYYFNSSGVCTNP